MFKLRSIWLTLLICVCTGLLVAQERFPLRPIAVIVPYQAGGSTEVFTRLVSEELAVLLRQPVIIEPKPGASGSIGARFVSVAKPDGYTLLANTPQQIMYDAMFRNLPFETTKDFKPVGLLGSAPLLVVTAASSPYKSFRDVLEAAKTRTVTYASGATGSLPHLTGERIALQGNLKMTHIPFPGAAPALVNVLGGHVDLLYSSATIVLPQIKSGKLRALAVTTRERMADLPDVPTIGESGLTGFDVTSWYGLWAPKETPEAIVKLLNEALRTASQSPALRKRMTDMSASPGALTSEQFANFIERERQVWMTVIRNAGLKPEQ